MSDSYTSPTSTPNKMATPGAPQKYMASSTPPPNMPPTPDAPKKSFLDGFTNSMKSFYDNLKSPTKTNDQSMDNGANPAAQQSIFDGGKKKRRTAHKSRGKKGGNPKKGMTSKTRKGKKDYITHKGDKYYNRSGKRQTKNRKGRKGKPYSKRR